MYTKEELGKLLIFDIEVISKTLSLKELNEDEKRIWFFRYHKKFYDKALEEKEKYRLAGMSWEIDENDPEDIYLKYAPLVPEFAKVVSIVFGKFDIKKDGTILKDFENITTNDEIDLLKKAAKVFDHLSDLTPAGFNIANYDIPVLAKRYLINELPIPNLINFKGKKPWEMKISDLASDWKLGGFEPVAFETLTSALGVKSSKKGNVNGMELGFFYYNNRCSLEDIAKYCQDDVDANMDILIKLIH